MPCPESKLRIGNIMRIGVRSLLLVLAGPTTVMAQQPTGRVEVGTGKDIHARIEIQRTRYTVGDTACLRISLINTSNRPVDYVAMGAGDMIRLVIRRNGTLVQPNAEPAGSASAEPAGFQPGETWPLTGNRWLPITTWGYSLEEAGEYSIEGIPQIAGGYAITDKTTVRSNHVTFTLRVGSSAHASCGRQVEARPKARKRTPAELRARTDSLQTASRNRLRAMVDTMDWRHDTIK